MKAFEEDGCFKEMRGEARRTAALAELAQEEADHNELMALSEYLIFPMKWK